MFQISHKKTVFEESIFIIFEIHFFRFNYLTNFFIFLPLVFGLAALAIIPKTAPSFAVPMPQINLPKTTLFGILIKLTKVIINLAKS